ncbi:FxsA family protein [Intrasporangium sp. DVR]|uniref:FxsA family protein n=1 Tax=Intrasporangium sp. DVR TaxID=3127867 RepID=UPI00313A5ABE
MTTPPRRGRLRPTRVAALLLLVVPILEVMALVGVGQVIGGWPTFFLLVAISVLGAWLIRLEGARAWGALVTALQSGRMPARELADGMLVLIGGTLLLTPGFLTDLVGFALVVPVTRPAARRLLEKVITRRLLAQTPFVGSEFGRSGFSGRVFPPAGAPGARGSGRDGRPGDDVIEGEIVDD